MADYRLDTPGVSLQVNCLRDSTCLVESGGMWYWFRGLALMPAEFSRKREDFPASLNSCKAFPFTDCDCAQPRISS